MPRDGRPPLGRERIIIGLPPELIVALDAVAGKGSRADYLIRLLQSDPKIQEMISMSQAHIIGQIVARIEKAGVRMGPNAVQLASMDPAHQLPPLFTRLIESGHGDDIMELMAQISAQTGFPDHMSNAEQGQFWVGYYQAKGE